MLSHIVSVLNNNTVHVQSWLYFVHNFNTHQLWSANYLTVNRQGGLTSRWSLIPDEQRTSSLLMLRQPDVPRHPHNISLWHYHAYHVHVQYIIYTYIQSTGADTGGCLGCSSTPPQPRQHTSINRRLAEQPALAPSLQPRNLDLTWIWLQNPAKKPVCKLKTSSSIYFSGSLSRSRQ